MIKSKLFGILSKLSGKEMGRFVDYVSSPYFNKNENIKKLCMIYKSFHPDFMSKNLTKEKVFEQLFPGRKYADGTFRNLNSDLLVMFEGFLALQNVSQHPVVLNKYLLKELNNKNIFSLFEKNYEKFIDDINKQKTRNSWYYLNYYILQSDKSLFNGLQNKYSKDDLEETEKSLIRFFLIRLLEIYSYVINKKRLSPKIEFDFSYMQELLEHLKKHNYEDTPAIQIHFNKLQLFLTNEEDYYYKVKHLLEKYGDLLGKEQQYNTYISLINYLKNEKPGGEKKSLLEAFEIRKRIIENNLFVSENRITTTFFRNQVKAGLILKKFDWVYDFINDYNKRLTPLYRKSTVNYCLALYHYEKTDFTNALKYLSKVEYTNHHYILDIKSLQTQIYWERGDIMLLKYFLDSYRHYLVSRKYLFKRKELLTHRNLINFISRMISLKMKYDYGKLVALKNEIANESNILKKDWLVTKVNEMIMQK